MSRLAELLGHGEEGRVLRSHAAKAASPKVKQLVYKRKVPEKQQQQQQQQQQQKKKKAGGVKRAPPVVVVEEEPVKRQRNTKKSATLRLAKGLVTSTTTVSSWSGSLSSADAIAAATQHLLAADAKFQSVVGKHGSPDFERDGSAFTALVKSIVYQQLAAKAAAAIHGRLVALCGGPESVTPAVVAALTADQFKGAGISARKGDYLRDLAEKFLSGALSDEKLAAMSEDDLITALTAVKGIGVWSAQMFMIFYLHKPDVLPIGDLGIRKGFQKLYKMEKEPSAAEMQDLSISWRPYRTLAAWYLWRVK